MPLFDQRFGIRPRATRTGTFEAPILKAIEIAENAILVFKHPPRPRFPQTFAAFFLTMSFNVVGPPTGHEACRPICEPGLGGLPVLNP